MAGGGIQRGVIYGSTDALGVNVAENHVDNRKLFATIFSALGIDPGQSYNLPNLPTFHRVEGKTQPITELLV